MQWYTAVAPLTDSWQNAASGSVTQKDLRTTCHLARSSPHVTHALRGLQETLSEGRSHLTRAEHDVQFFLHWSLFRFDAWRRLDAGLQGRAAFGTLPEA